MFSLHAQAARLCDGVSRRELLRLRVRSCCRGERGRRSRSLAQRIRDAQVRYRVQAPREDSTPGECDKSYPCA